MRKLLIAVFLTALVVGCSSSSPLAPDEAGSLQPAEECIPQQQFPC